MKGYEIIGSIIIMLCCLLMIYLLLIIVSDKLSANEFCKEKGYEKGSRYSGIVCYGEGGEDYFVEKYFIMTACKGFPFINRECKELRFD